MKKILILSGNKSTNASFLGIDLENTKTTIASFQELNYVAKENKYTLMINKAAIKDFDVVYFRVVGKFREHAAIISYYCKNRKIPLQDPCFIQDGLVQVPIFKGLETLLMADNNIPIPKTGFVTLNFLINFTTKNFEFPCVIKDTESMQAKEVYLVENESDLEKLHKKLKEKSGKSSWHKKYLVQEFVNASHRHRIFVLGDEILAGIIRPMKWYDKIYLKDNCERKKISSALNPIPEDEKKLSLEAAVAARLNIAGVDLIVDDKTGKKYIMEVNYEPQWEALAKDNSINVEKNILKYLASL